MIVTVEITIYSHPKKDVEKDLIYAARRLTTRKESIKVVFPEDEPEKVILQFWMPDKSHYKVVDDISEEVKMSCVEYLRESIISFENDRKRKPRSRRKKT